MKNLFIILINLYQKIISPDHSFWAKTYFPYGYCKFYPSCSEYSKKSIQKNGLLQGVIKGGWRIIRCNPFSKGGLDLP